MKNRRHTRTALDEILQSVSDVLFPAELGEKHIEIDSRSSEGDTPLHVLCWRKDRAGVKVLLKAGADVNAVGDMDETPLHVAISQDDEMIVEALLKAGAALNIRSEFGETALEKAMKKGGNIGQLVKKYHNGT
jgi:uncharacterized protein